MIESNYGTKNRSRDLIELFKLEFKILLDKGILSSFEHVFEVIENKYDIDLKDESIRDSSKSWYSQIVSFHIISQYINDKHIHEISFHRNGILNIRGINLNKQIILDYSQIDLQILFDVLALSFGQDWNFNNPFCSFRCTISGMTLRATLVHFNLEANNCSKLFLRKIKEIPLSINKWNFSTSLIQILHHAITSKKNIILSGATNSGKTSLLRSLCQIINPDEHVIVIEDTHEILSVHPLQTNLLANSKKNNMAHLVAYSLRLTPDRIIVGEIRSKEIIPFILAMNTGHKGMLSTIHADSAAQTIKRLSLLYLIESEGNLSWEDTISLVCSNVDMVIHVKDKYITEIIKIIGAGDGVPYYENVFSAPINLA